MHLNRSGKASRGSQLSRFCIVTGRCNLKNTPAKISTLAESVYSKVLML
jgi:hypothetical protein